MMMMLIGLLVVTSIVQTALAQCLNQPDNLYATDSAARKEQLRSQLEFSLNLLKAVGRQQPSDNLFISPLSIYNALLLAYFAANGHTEESLRSALFLPKKQVKTDLFLSYRLQRIISSTDAYKSQVNTANRFFLSKEQTVLDCMKDIFDDEIQQLDFSNKQSLARSVETINGWVANVTQNNIQNLVSADSLNPSTQLILANAAYFKSIWKNQFNPKDTRMGKFYVTKENTVPVPMMFQHNTFNYWRSSELEAEIIELPYKNGEISMIVLLPESSNTTNMLQRMEGRSLVNIVNGLNSANAAIDMEVKLPKFTIERTLELTPILESLGAGDLFQATADLTGLTGGPRILLSNAVHKAKIQVDERGSEASAATVFTDIRIPSDGFVCDRPFVYLLYDKVRTTLLFAGILNDPTK